MDKMKMESPDMTAQNIDRIAALAKIRLLRSNVACADLQ